MIFDEKTFCGKVFNDAINLSLESFVKKYNAESESVEENLFFKSTTFVVNDSTTLEITSNTPSKVTSCQCQLKDLLRIEQFLKTVQNTNLFEYDNFMGSLHYYPENIKGLSMSQIAIHAEKTMFYYFVEVILTYDKNLNKI